MKSIFSALFLISTASYLAVDTDENSMVDKVERAIVQQTNDFRQMAIKLKISNTLNEPRTLSVEANDSVDEIEMPARSVVTLTRCFPTTLSLKNQSDQKNQADEIKLADSSELSVTSRGLEKQP